MFLVIEKCTYFAAAAAAVVSLCFDFVSNNVNINFHYSGLMKEHLPKEEGFSKGSLIFAWRFTKRKRKSTVGGWPGPIPANLAEWLEAVVCWDG